MGWPVEFVRQIPLAGNPEKISLLVKKNAQLSRSPANIIGKIISLFIITFGDSTLWLPAKLGIISQLWIPKTISTRIIEF